MWCSVCRTPPGVPRFRAVVVCAPSPGGVRALLLRLQRCCDGVFRGDGVGRGEQVIKHSRATCSASLTALATSAARAASSECSVSSNPHMESDVAALGDC